MYVCYMYMATYYSILKFTTLTKWPPHALLDFSFTLQHCWSACTYCNCVHYSHTSPCENFSTRTVCTYYARTFLHVQYVCTMPELLYTYSTYVLCQNCCTRTVRMYYARTFLHVQYVRTMPELLYTYSTYVLCQNCCTRTVCMYYARTFLHVQYVPCHCCLTSY